MKIVHILEDYSILSGGIRTVVKNLHDKLKYNNHDSMIVSPYYEDDDDIVKVEIRKGTPWNYTKNLKTTLEQLHKESSIDIIHIHGVWMFPQYIACKFADKNNIPYVVSFHGMFEPWLWSKGFLKKRLYLKFLTHNLFSKATALHSITPAETEDLKERFPKTKVVEIPNLIDAVEDNEINTPIKNETPYILYLGRLDSKKGIDLLIKAFAQIKSKDVLLKIVGYKNKYHLDLKKLVKDLSLGERIEFLGLKKGKEKARLYKEATIFVAPSHSEVIGMVNLEAAMAGIPVITTHQTGISENWNFNGGILINPKTEEIKNAINKVLDWDDTTRIKNGQKLKEYVINDYSWNGRYSDWDNLYKSMASNK